MTLWRRVFKSTTPGFLLPLVITAASAVITKATTSVVTEAASSVVTDAASSVVTKATTFVGRETAASVVAEAATARTAAEEAGLVLECVPGSTLLGRSHCHRLGALICI